MQKLQFSVAMTDPAWLNFAKSWGNQMANFKDNPRSRELYKSLLDIAVGKLAIADGCLMQGLEHLRLAMPAFKAAAEEEADAASCADLAALNDSVITVLQLLLNDAATLTAHEVVDLKSDLADAYELQRQAASWPTSRGSLRGQRGPDPLLQ